MHQGSMNQQHVVSADGTRIGYLVEGSGPAVVLVQGAMADVHAYRELAAALSGTFTVIRAERRGRGLSPRTYTPTHDVARDVQDLDAIMTTTGARMLFGLSSGAVIVLEAARTLPRVERIAVFEPPLSRDGIDRVRMRQLFSDIDRRSSGAALVGALVTAGTAPPVVGHLPRWAAHVLGRLVLTIQALVPAPGTPLRDLLPGVRYDFHDVAQVDGHPSQYADVRRPVLLLSGTESPAFLGDAVRDLHELLPDAAHVELPGLGHDGPWNAGGPEAVAAELVAFLAPAPTDGSSTTTDPR